MSRSKLPDKQFSWNSGLAYAIGLLATDGCLSGDGRHIIMRSSDIQLLKTFQKCLMLSNRISQSVQGGWAKKPSYKIQFGNVQFYRWLLKIGLSPAKTHTIGKLDIPAKYFPDFLRGHLDGDGSIWTYRDSWNTFKDPKYVYTRLYTNFISASPKHINWLRENISNLLSIKGHLYREKKYRSYQTANMWKLKFAKNDSIKLLSWIYYSPNVPCLIRKRKIAKKFI